MLGKFFRHYGTPRHSGRYPWGSGEDPHQGGNTTLTARVDALRRKGLSEKDAAREVGMSIAQLRSQKSLERAERVASETAQIKRLRDKGYGTTAIAERMGKPESSIRSLEASTISEKAHITKETSEMLRREVGKDSYIDVGKGVEAQLGISETRLKTSIKALENDGYKVINVQVDQLGTDKKTTVKVLAPPGTEYRDVVTNMHKIRLPQEYTEDGGRSFLGILPPVNVSSSRIKVAYREEGGGDKDGLIELRRGAPDLSLGNARYGQVRIAVDGTHYLKGMAIHVDDLPRGVDIRFNTNKTNTGVKTDAFKKISDDPDNPFGSTIKQIHYIDADGKKKLSPLNIVGSEGSANIEGRWSQWSNALSSQIMSKQPPAFTKQQLDLVVKQKERELDEINKLTNPVIKRRLLDSLADDCDSSAGHLKAAALPRQSNHVLIPVPEMPDHQVYAPKYKNGEKVVLIRHPHGGTFEIPELVVNNNHRAAKKLLGDALDAVGISPKVAQRLSGADFDGDHVLVIPNNGTGNNRIRTSSPLAGLKDFDPVLEYPHVPGMKVMGEKGGGNKQTAMGDISNLITDMTIKGANHNEIARAVRHSMVVIDSEKHRLNYKLSEQQNGIPQLKEKYQGGKTSGAATLVSKSRSDEYVPERKEGGFKGPISSRTGMPKKIYVDPKTGEKIYTPTGATYTRVSPKTGKITVVTKTTKTTKMDATKDAHTLSSGTTIEGVYADHANRLKALANESRRSSVNTPNIPYSPEAKKRYSKEVASLSEKLKKAEANKPLERRAQILANQIVAAKRKSNPHMSYDDLKKVKGQALAEARRRTGANKPSIVITPQEWAAIQKGAISPSRLEEIIRNSDLDAVRALATPRQSKSLSKATASRVRSLRSQGYTTAQIATQLGVSATTISTMLTSQ